MNIYKRGVGGALLLAAAIWAQPDAAWAELKVTDVTPPDGVISPTPTATFCKQGSGPSNCVDTGKLSFTYTFDYAARVSFEAHAEGNTTKNILAIPAAALGQITTYDRANAKETVSMDSSYFTRIPAEKIILKMTFSPTAGTATTAEAFTPETAEVELAFDGSPPGLVGDLKAEGSDNGVLLSWTTDDRAYPYATSNNVENFYVYYGTKDFRADLKLSGAATDANTTAGGVELVKDITVETVLAVGEGGGMSASVGGLANGTTYYFAVDAVDHAGNRSGIAVDHVTGLPVLVSATPVTSFTLAEAAGIDDKLPCFLATAVMGSPHGATLDQLRFFRDRVLKRLPGGRTFIGTYYRLSPPFAARLAGSPHARAVLRPAVVAAGALSYGVALGFDAAAEHPAMASGASLLGIGLMFWGAGRKSKNGTAAMIAATVLLSMTGVSQASEVTAATDTTAETSSTASEAVSAPAAAPAAAEPAAAQPVPSEPPAAAPSQAQAPQTKSEDTSEPRPEPQRFQRHREISEYVQIQGGTVPLDDAAVEVRGDKTFYTDVYGSKPGIQFMATWEYELTRAFGVPVAGVRGGYYRKTGHALREQADGFSTSTVDRMTMSMLPLAATVGYHFNFIDPQYIIPYVAGGVDWVILSEQKESDSEGIEFFRYGWDVRAGVALTIDWLDRDSAANMKENYGIDHTHLVGEYQIAKLDNFGKAKNFDISYRTWFAGLAFEY